MTERDPFAGRSIFVTGAAGVVGSWLVDRLLASRAHVVALLRDEDPRSELFRSGNDRRVIRVSGSLEDGALLERVLVRHEVDVVFHLGAQTQVRQAQRFPFATLEANVRGTYNILEAARRLSRPVQAVIVASSDKAYGHSESLPYTEQHPLQGRNIYDASKSAADLLSAAYAASFQLPVAIARCANVYGGGDLNWDRIVPGTIRYLLRGEPPIVRSDGSPKRDYLFVEDAVRAYMTLGTALLHDDEIGEAFNFGAGEPVSVLELVGQIAQAVGRTDLEPVIQSNAPNEISSQWLDSSKARDRLGWTPSVNVEEGLRRTAEWYRAILP